LAAWFGWISTRISLSVLVAAFAIACAAWVLAVVREDEDRPRGALLIAAIAGYAVVDWVAFRGAGPNWLQAGVLVVLLIPLRLEVSEPSRGRPNQAGRPSATVLNVSLVDRSGV